MPEGWSKHYSKTWKKPYYFNKKTGKQVWEHPGTEGGDSPAGSVAGDSASVGFGFGTGWASPTSTGDAAGAERGELDRLR